MEFNCSVHKDWMVKEKGGREWGPYAQTTAKNILYLLSRAKRELPKDLYEKIKMPQNKTIVCPKCGRLATVLGTTYDTKYAVKCERNGAFLIEAVQEREAKKKCGRMFRSH